MKPQAGSPKGPLPKDLREPAPAVTHHLPTDTCKTDPDLAAVVAAWPEATRGALRRHPGDGEAASEKGNQVATIARLSIP